MNALTAPALHQCLLRPAYAVAADLAVVLPAAPRVGLLWVPAMGVPARKYATFAAAMQTLGIAVALHEARGCGSSRVRAGRNQDWGYPALLDDIAASRSCLATEFPQIRWHIGGHSLGAQLAALALALRPDDWAGYVIAGSGQPWWRTFPLWQQPILLGTFAAFRLLSATFGYFPGDRVGFAGREARGVVRDWARSGLSGRYSIAGIPQDLEPSLSEVRTPVLALHLSQDNYVPAQSLTHLLAKLPNAPTTRQEIGPAEFSGGRAGHFDWLRDPQPVARRIAAWVSGIPDR